MGRPDTAPPSPVPRTTPCTSSVPINLTRYGDPLDPDADLTSMQQAARWLRPGGLFVLAMPIGRDCIVWNSNRVYGRLRLAALLEGWHVVGFFGGFPDDGMDTAPLATAVPSVGNGRGQKHIMQSDDGQQRHEDHQQSGQQQCNGGACTGSASQRLWRAVRLKEQDSSMDCEAVRESRRDAVARCQPVIVLRPAAISREVGPGHHTQNARAVYLA